MNRLYNRNPFEQPAPRDSEIMRRASSIELRLYHDDDGGIQGSIEIHCAIGDPFDDKYRSQEEVDHQQAAALRFIRNVMRGFTEKEPGDGMAAAG